MAKNFYQYFSYQIADNVVQTIFTDANFLTLLSNTAATNIRVSIGGQAFQELPVGLSVELPRDTGETFLQLQFQNLSGGAATITFAISNGRVVNSSLTLTGTVLTNEPVSVASAPANITATNVAGAASIAASATRHEIIIQNQHASYNLWVGDASVNSATPRGLIVPAGGILVLKTSAAIYFHSPSGNCVVGYMEIKT